MTKLKNACKNFALLIVTLSICWLIAETIARNFTTVRNVGPSFTEYDPVLGKWHKRNFSATRIGPEFVMQFSTNSGGFRGPEINPDGARPLLILGDSFSMGYGVTDGKEYASLLRQKLATQSLNSPPIINAGMGNNGTGRWVKFLRERAADYNPEYAILQIHNTDYFDNILEKLFRLDDQGNVIESSIAKESNTRKLQSIIDSIPIVKDSYLLGLAKQMAFPTATVENNETYVKQDNSYAIALLHGILDQALSLCEEQGISVIAVIVSDLEGQTFEALNQYLLEKNLTMIAIPDRKERPDMYFEVDGHWNETGHEVVADMLFKQISNKLND